jgi:hypothetical protein
MSAFFVNVAIAWWRNLSSTFTKGELTQGEIAYSNISTTTSDGTDRITTPPKNFWRAQCPTKEKLNALRIVSFDVLIHAPELDFRGVRDPSDPSITNLFSPTRLVLQKPDERGNLHYVECQSDELSGEDSWDKFSREIAKYIRGRWPEGFGGDHEYEMGSLQGTRIHLTESYYDEIGLPKLIDRGFPNSITVIPQLALGKEIYGRIW